MNPIDQIKPPVAPPATRRVERKQRSPRDSNNDKRPKSRERKESGDKRSNEHIDKLV